MTVFDQRKRRILEDLQSDAPDLSPKGRPDDEILQLLELINSNDDYVSTSSCSGRAVVFLDGDNNGQGEEAQGRWLMTRHTRFGEELLTRTIEQLYTILFGSLTIGVCWRSNEPSRLITLKFEPLIMHVLCRDVHSASRLLHIATVAGYRESGISVSALGTPQEKVLVAIRTTAIRADVPLASYDGENQSIRPFGLTREYLHNLLQIINDKFEKNELRKQNLFTSLNEVYAQKTTTVCETKDQRKARKREEGLKLQAAKSEIQRDTTRNEGEGDNILDDMSLDHLVTL